MATDWKSAFLRQAKSEYPILLMLLNQRGIERCHSLHYLQMVSEKLAKGMHSGGWKPPAKHQTLVRFLRAARSNPAYPRWFGFKDQKQFRSFIDSLLPVAQEIESLAPEGKLERRNSAYPWQMPLGGIVAPCEENFAGLEAEDYQVRKMMSFLRLCFQYLQALERA